MSKQNIKRFPSLRNNTFIHRRQSQEDNNKTAQSQLKSSVNLESELSKKIQNKLRMRKKSSNIAPLGHFELKTQSDAVQPETTSIDGSKNERQEEAAKKQYFKEGTDLKELIEKTWDNNASLIEKTLTPFVNRGILKQMILEQSEIIICQLSKGDRIESILIEKGQKIIKAHIAKVKTEEKERSLLSMIDGRIKHLQNIGVS